MPGQTADLIGRDDELRAIAAFLDRGPSPAAALVLEGAAGIGKTTLWLWSIDRAAERSYRVLSSRPAESDSSLSFVAVADILAGTLEEVLPVLPGPQRSALEAALLLEETPDGTSVGGALAFGFLNALRALSRDGPIVLAIDDLQWIDPPSARLIRFAVQRLRGEPVRLILATRDEESGRIRSELGQALPGRIETVTLGPLSLGALFELLRTTLGTTFNRPTLRQLREVSGGNPLYALEIGRSLLRRGGRIEPGAPLPVPGGLRDLVSERLDALPTRTRDALLVAALSANPSVELIGRVLRGEAELDAAIDAKAIDVSSGRVAFAHPLFAAAIREQAGTERARVFHGRLAQAVPTAEERALHLALATDGVDASAAEVLADAAGAARRRGAPVAAATFLEHTLRLSPPEHSGRLGWEIELADVCFEAGDAPRATELLVSLLERLPQGNDRARVLWRLAAISGELGPPSDAVGFYEQALQELRDEPVLETRIHSDLAVMAIFVNDLPRALTHGRKAVALSRRVDDPGVKAEALASLSYTEFTAGRPLRPELMERALALEELSDDVRVDRSPSIVRGFQLLWTGDLDAARSRFERARQPALDRGDESNLSICSYYLAILETLAGNWGRAADHVREAVELAEHTGVNWDEVMYARALLDAHLGRVDSSLATAQELLRRSEERDEAAYGVRSLSVLGFLELSRGDATAAEGWLAQATELAFELGIGDPGLLRFVPDRVESLVAVDRADDAAKLLERFERPARELGRAWALAVAERCRGLVLGATGDRRGAVEALLRAQDGHRATPMPFELGRTLLALGGAQRRLKRRRAARDSLDEALEVFERLGAPLWAAKARGELGRIAGRRPATGVLTPAETRIAERVARGMTNREVAAELVVAVHTVEAALTRIYGKLGVRSRTELARRFPEQNG